MELKLRLAGIRITPNEMPRVFVNINAIPMPSARGAFFYSVSVELDEFVRVDRTGASQIAATWNRAGTGIGDQDGIKSMLSDILDVFLVDWLKANPRTAPAP